MLSNLYRNELDHEMASAGYEMTRYADDLVIQCRTRAEAAAALEKIQQWIAERDLTLHPTKTKRTNGQSLQAIIVNVNRTLRGWFEYSKHNWRTTFPAVDGWVRMRETRESRSEGGARSG